MENKLTKKYGLFTAICMVVGIVIGSGIFFKTEAVLGTTNGNVLTGVLGLLVVGIIMLICSYAFSLLAQKYEKVNGIVDYAEMALGEKFAYYVGWFMTLIYTPAITSVLAWLSARYTCVLIGKFEDPVTGPECLVIAGLFLAGGYALNALSPILAGKFQVSGTIIKLIPLCLMAVIGTVLGLKNGQLVGNFTGLAANAPEGMTISTGFDLGGLLMAAVALAFAYEGWIIATSINAELKDSKKNLPIALMVGGAIVVAVYVLYYLGICGAIPVGELLSSDLGSQQAFINLFGNVFGTLLTVFIIISCLCTMNGLMLGCVRGMYSFAIRGRGPKPAMFAQVDKVTNMPHNSAVVGLLVCFAWLVYFYGANLTTPWFGPFCFDSSELPIITLYALYIPIFLSMMKDKTQPFFKRFVVPVAASLCSLFMVGAAIYSHGIAKYQAAVAADKPFTFPALFYLIVFAVVIAVGALFAKKKKI
ncbi:MAG: APC family permease [Ruminococcaceae bacterium]|nr:APC family permease [Oscillospiraceae bacterium]